MLKPVVPIIDNEAHPLVWGNQFVARVQPWPRSDLDPSLLAENHSKGKRLPTTAALMVRGDP